MSSGDSRRPTPWEPSDAYFKQPLLFGDARKVPEQPGVDEGIRDDRDRNSHREASHDGE